MYHWPSSCQLSNYPHLTSELSKEQHPSAEISAYMFL